MVNTDVVAYLERNNLEETSRRLRFMVNSIHVPDIPPGAPIKGDDWGFETNIDGEAYEFVWSYNRLTLRYSLNIVGKTGRIVKFYPVASEPKDIRNFRSTNAFTPDARLGIVDRTGVGDTITPETLNNGDHQLVVMLGNFERRVRVEP